MLRVPGSRDAPHRAPDLHCYVRRGRHSEPMRMREVQNMMLRLATRGDRLERDITDMRGRFRPFIASKDPEWAAFLITCVPIAGPISLGRVYNKPGLSRWVRNIQIRSGLDELIAPHEPTDQRPILAGARWLSDGGRWIAEKQIDRDGKISVAVASKARNEHSDPEIYMAWVLGSLVNALVAVDAVRQAAEAPDTEYAIELTIGGHPGGMTNPTIILESTWREGACLPAMEVIFPRLSFGAVNDISDVITATHQDILDCIGRGRVDAPRIELEFPRAKP